MGANCSSIICTNSTAFDPQAVDEMNSRKPERDQMENTEPKTSKKAEQGVDIDYYKTKEVEDKIIKTQALFRGSQARREFEKSTKDTKDTNEYKKSENKSENDFYERASTADPIALNESQKLIQSTVGITERRELPLVSLENGARYLGEWRNGCKDGHGIQYWPDGSRYEGNWMADKSHGKGKLYHADGDIYEGEWSNDKANGHGTYTHTNGSRYAGNWKDDKQHGYGTETWPDKSNMRETTEMEKNMDKENYFLAMDQSMREILITMILTIMVYINGLMEEPMKDTGITIRWRVKER